ncbi:MAG TPA: DMT family transporter [Candidatus Dormibacteraeota bacterium]|jgi:drug/metabolite transporter (DMT)-like permease|nr:DMT family transporter [Candidatus Dormibacteraeota bacterium]
MAVRSTTEKNPVHHVDQGLADRFSVLLVALAATMWATDIWFRSHLVHLSASQIVVVEDGLITLCLLFFLVRGLPEMRRLSWRGWLAVLLIGVGPQAVATLLFTESFKLAAQHQLFAETYVLQQTQPLIAIALAWIILGERRRIWFWPVVVLALAAVYLVLFASDPTAPVTALQHGEVEVGLFALGAAALWASGTVLGRFVLGTLSFPTTTALRFTVALPVLIIVLLVQSGSAAFSQYRATDIVPFVLIALIPGLLSLLLYYRALASTPASLATIAEMAYPVAATIIASAPLLVLFGQTIFFGQRLYASQAVGTVLLVGVILLLNWTKERTPPVVVRDVAAA